MPDIILTVVSGEPIDIGLSIPGVQGPMGQEHIALWGQCRSNYYESIFH
jgi:hypothetical protein